jgi:hypothetical protein
MEKKESFIIYKSFFGPISQLNDHQMGELFRAIFEYQINGKDVNHESEIFMAFQFFKNQFQIDLKKYEKVCEKRSAAASKRWNANDANDAIASKRKEKDAKDADNDNDNDNEKDNDNGKDNEKDNGKEKDNELMNPFSDGFLQFWEGWLQYKKEEFKFRFRSMKSQQISINGLHKLSEGDESIALKIIEQSIINGWKGFFELKKDQKLSQAAKKNQGISMEYMESLKNRINGGN